MRGILLIETLWGGKWRPSEYHAPFDDLELAKQECAYQASEYGEKFRPRRYIPAPAKKAKAKR